MSNFITVTGATTITRKKRRKWRDRYHYKIHSRENFGDVDHCNVAIQKFPIWERIKLFFTDFSLS